MKTILHTCLFQLFLFVAFSLPAQEICNNGIDDDGNGFKDGLDAACNPCDSITQLNFEDGQLPSAHGWTFVNNTGASSSSVTSTGSGNALQVNVGNNFQWRYPLSGLCLDSCNWSYDLDFNITSESGGFCSCSWVIGVQVNSCLSLWLQPQSFGLHHYRFENNGGIFNGFVDGNPTILNTSHNYSSGSQDIYFLYGNMSHTASVLVDNISFFHCGTSCSCTPDTTYITACDSALINGSWYYSSQVITDILTASNGCDSIAITNLKIQSFNGFSNTTVCLGDTVAFTDNNTYLQGSIAGWLWDFGDGSPSDSSQHPEHVYTSGGSYIATRITTTSVGCADTVSKNVEVYHVPVAGFSSEDVCLNDSVYFVNTSSISFPGNISEYLWMFGDDSLSTVANPVHIYATGTYAVTLVVTSSDMCVDSISHTVNTFDPPVAVFVASNSCLTDSVEFINTSLPPSFGSQGVWYWNFGDATPIDSLLWNPKHRYALPGNYTVALITVSGSGCADTLKDTITIFPLPVVNFSATEVCLNQPTAFYDSTIINGGSISSWEWDFGNSTPPNNSQNPLHTYTNFGQFEVTVTVTTNNGCIDSTTQNIFVHPLPDALFTANNVCDGATVIFTGNSTIPANPTNDVIQQWFWSIGDGTTASTQNTTHLYSSAGSYPVQLSIASDFGCADSITKTITVNPNPVVVYTATDTSGCSPLCTPFQNTSSVPGGGGIVTWLWNFGDGTTSNSQEVQHCYNTTGTLQTFSPSLTVTSDSGCVASLTMNNYITVFPVPNAEFLASPQTVTSTNPVISITNTSLIATLWNWNFGDSLTDNSQYPPPHTYTDTGAYIITLIASTPYGCYDTAYTTVIVEPDFMFYVPNAFTPNGDGINDAFTGTGTYIKEFEMFIFDRWGNLIYKTDDINKPWNGTANSGNEIAQQDVYVYLIKATNFKGKEHKYRGIVTLIR